MALRIDASLEHAYAPSPWVSGGLTISFWMYRLNGAITTRFLTGLLDMDDATPESSADPRITIGSGASSLPNAVFAGSAGSTSDTATGTYATGGWSLVTVVITGSGDTLETVEVFVDAVGSGSPGSGSRVMSANGAFDRLQIGSNTTAHSNCDFAHWAFFDTALSQSQITELLTKKPDAITGATPVVYYPLIADTNNAGSGGATYNLTISGTADLNSTNDATLPALSGSSGASTTVAVTDAGDTSSVTATAPVYATLALTDAGDVSAVTGQAPVAASVAVTDAVDSSSVTGSAGSNGNIRLTLGMQRERGGYAASMTSLKWCVFNANHTVVIASGTALTTDANGNAVIDVNGTSYAVGDYVPVLVTDYNAATAAQDRVVRTFFGFVPAQAQP